MRILDVYAPRHCPLCERELAGGEVCCRRCYRFLSRDRLKGRNRCRRCFLEVAGTEEREKKEEEREQTGAAPGEYSSESYVPEDRVPREKVGITENCCKFCSGRNVFFDGHLSLYSLSEPWKKILQKWKFGNDRGLFRIFLPAIRTIVRQIKYLNINRVGYIHSGRSQYRLRAYSPCSDLAREVSRMSGIPFGVDLKKKPVFKQSQRGYSDRFIQIRNSIEIIPEFKGLTYTNYLLVEDIFTTGATANEVARLLKMNGAKKVILLSMLLREEKG